MPHIFTQTFDGYSVGMINNARPLPTLTGCVSINFTQHLLVTSHFLKALMFGFSILLFLGLRFVLGTRRSGL